MIGTSRSIEEINGGFSVAVNIDGLELYMDVEVVNGEVKAVTRVYVESHGEDVDIPFYEGDLLSYHEDDIKTAVEQMYLSGGMDYEQEPEDYDD